MTSHADISYLPADIQFKIVEFESKVDYNALKLHSHNYTEIFIFLKGGGHHLIDFKEYEILSNQLHFVFPNQVHLVKRENASRGFVILFKADFLSIEAANPLHEFYLNFLNDPILSLDKEQFGMLNNLFQLLQSEYLKKNEQFSQMMIKYYLNALLIQSLRYKTISNLGSNNTQAGTQSSKICYDFLSLLEKEFSTRHSIDFYTDALHIGYKKLASSTKKVLGKTPKNLINERLNLSIKRYLLYTDYSIKEIMHKLDFDELSNFNKFFRRFNGVPPSEFRSNWAKKYK